MFFHDYGGAKGYWHLEIKGEGCEALGLAGCAQIVFMVGGGVSAGRFLRWRLVRFDWAWDGVPFTVGHVASAAKAGWMRSRSFRPDCTEVWESGTGNTAYLYGERRRRGDCVVRCYDRRGPVRFEIEFKGQWAESLGVFLALRGPDAWPALLLSALRECVEFCRPEGDRHYGDRLPWWKKFLAGRECEALGLRRRVPRPPGAKALARITNPLLRVLDKAAAASDAIEILCRVFGPDWFVAWARSRNKSALSDRDEALVMDLLAEKARGALDWCIPVKFPAEVAVVAPGESRLPF